MQNIVTQSMSNLLKGFNEQGNIQRRMSGFQYKLMNIKGDTYLIYA